jgi:hypothetical protein
MADTAGTSNEEHPYHELIQQFKEICAVDDDVAEMCLTQADGNLQDAVVRFLSGEALLQEEQQQPPRDIPMAHVDVRRRRNVNVVYDNSSTPSEASTPINPHPNNSPSISWSAWFSRLLAVPFQFFYYSIRQIFAFTFGLFGGLFPAITSPEEDVQTFKNEIETKYSDVDCQLNWHHSTYADVSFVDVVNFLISVF